MRTLPTWLIGFACSTTLAVLACSSTDAQPAPGTGDSGAAGGATGGGGKSSSGGTNSSGGKSSGGAGNGGASSGGASGSGGALPDSGSGGSLADSGAGGATDASGDGSTPLTDAAVASDAGNVPDGQASVIGAGPYSIVYSADSGIGIDQRASVTASFRSTGELLKYDAGGNEAPAIGTNAASETYLDSMSGTGRWNGGTSAGIYYSSAPFTWSATQGFHYAIAIPTPVAALPASGGSDYVLLQATKPTIDDGSIAAGTATGTAHVTHGSGTSKIGLSFTVTMTDGTYTIVTTGGTADPSTSELARTTNHMFVGSVPVTGAGAACGGTACVASFRGFFGGPAADRIGFAFVITSTGGGRTVRGAALFSKQ